MLPEFMSRIRRKSMEKRRLLILFLAITGILFQSAYSADLKDIEFGFSAGAGYTMVDFEAETGYADSTLEDWDQFHYKFTAYGLYPLSPKMRVGLEVGYHYLYYYYYIIPYDDFSPVYREAEWSTISYLVMLRYDLFKLFFIQTGAGIHSFIGDGTTFSLSTAFGIKPRVGDYRFPVFLRFDPIFSSGTQVITSDRSFSIWFPLGTISIGVAVEYAKTRVR
jgi:hypothetical protein